MARRISAFAALWMALAPSSAQAKVYAAAGKVDITPDLSRETVWLAGFGAMGRRPKGVHDPLYARALVLSDGDKTVALVAADLLGLYRQDVLDIRRSLGWPEDKSYVFIAATHTHSGPDTLGLWGRFPGISGVNARYHERVKNAIVSLLRDLAGHLQEARLTVASADVNPKGLCRDSRDPVVIDPELQAAQARTLSGEPIGTLVRWSCHPEVLGSENREISADYPGRLCARIEAEGGGPCVFFSGVIGGLLTPDVDRSKGLEGELTEMGRVGDRVADAALEALRRSGERVSEGPIRFDSKVLRVPVENSRYLLFLHHLTYGHRLFDADGHPLPEWKSWWLPLRHLIRFPLPENMRPWVETEISRVRVGQIDILGIPGELFPELAVGGYDGRYRFSYPLIRPTNPNPPDLSKAPKGPYLREELKSKHGILVGLANDEIGYIMPLYDFQVTPGRSMTPRPKGDHYEETNSIGRSAAGILLDAYARLLAQ